MEMLSRRENKPSLYACLVFLCLVLAPMDPILLINLSLNNIYLSYFRILALILLLWSLPKFIFKDFIIIIHNKNVTILTVWVIYLILSFFWSFDFLYSSKYIIVLVTHYFVIYLVVKMDKKISVWKAIEAIVIVTLVFAIIEEITGFRPKANRQHLFVNEITAFYVNPAHLGATLALSYPYFFINAFQKNRLKKFYSILVVILIIYFIFRTGTKGNIICLLIETVLLCNFIAKDLKNKKEIFIVVILVVLTVIAIMKYKLIPNELLDKILQLGGIFESDMWENEENSFGSRAIVWEIGYNLFKEKPVIGWGIGTSTILLRMLNFSSTYSLHNWWLELAIEGGIISFSLFLFLFVRLISYLFLLGKEIDMSLYTLFVMLIGFIPISLTVGEIWDIWIFWIILGLCISKAHKLGWLKNCERDREQLIKVKNFLKNF